MEPLVKTAAEIAAMRAGGKILAQALEAVVAAVRPGVTTAELDQVAEAKLTSLGATPSFLNYGAELGNPFPATLCTSVNNAVVHGIPQNKTPLAEGDIVGLDIGCWYQGFCTDMAVTVPVGKVSPEAQKLIAVTAKALSLGLAEVKAGVRVGNVGAAVQAYVEANGFSVVRQLVGHGVGRAVHEDPQVPNFGRRGSGAELKAGMTIAVEPMVNQGGVEVETLDDGWTVVTADGSLSAHFEHTVLVTTKGCDILTTT
jgi:methionyl aminopeptidase